MEWVIGPIIGLLGLLFAIFVNSQKIDFVCRFRNQFLFKIFAKLYLWHYPYNDYDLYKSWAEVNKHRVFDKNQYSSAQSVVALFWYRFLDSKEMGVRYFEPIGLDDRGEQTDAFRGYLEYLSIMKNALPGADKKYLKEFYNSFMSDINRKVIFQTFEKYLEMVSIWHRRISTVDEGWKAVHFEEV